MHKINWIWTDHIKNQLVERKISRTLVEETLQKYDELVTGYNNRKIYQKTIGNKVIRVITENNRLITVYLTDKVKKYTQKGK